MSNPKLILVVGSLGLGSNLAGFLVLGGHGHDHGPSGHSHGEGEGEHDHDHDHAHAHSHDDIDAAEQGRSDARIPDREVADDRGRVADLLPEAALANQASLRVRSERPSDARSELLRRNGSLGPNQSRERHRRRASSLRHGYPTNIDDMSIYPSSFRQEIIDASRAQQQEGEESTSDSGVEPQETTPLVHNGSGGSPANGHYGSGSVPRRRRDSFLHRLHNHNKPKKPGQSHGHSHGDMGMNAMILHVLGDALGNVGVIVTALIIWLTDWPGRYYADPAVSLFITLIILRSALPLTLATSRILLQATPDHIEVNDVKKDIQNLPGIVSCHHVHVWQLSDTNVVASMHIQVAFPISEEGGERYMELSRLVRQCLHAYGIHSATIQPEFCLDRDHGHEEDAMRQDGAEPDLTKCANMQGDSCLLECVDDCAGKGCCSGANSRAGSDSSVFSGNEGH